MSLLDALNNPPKVNPRRLDIILAEVTPEERKALTYALEEPEQWTADSLSKTLTEEQRPVSSSSIKRYRREVLGIK